MLELIAIPPYIEMPEKDKRALASLCPDHICRSMKKQPVEGTGEWIIQRRQFEDWLDEKHSMKRLWISGAPACGKSYLAKCIISKLKALGKSVIYGFLHESNPKENNVRDLLAATLQQALSIEPRLIREFLLPGFETAQGPDIWSQDTLEKLWPKVMARVSAERPIIVIIDGFDEIERKCQKVFLECLGDFGKESQAPNNLRLLFFSREYPRLPIDSGKHEFARYAITTKDTEADIAVTVDGHLKELGRLGDYTPELLTKIGEEIPKAANGMFLWANLILEDLERAVPTEEGLQELLDDLPEGIAKLYDYIFGRMWKDRPTRKFVRQALLWIVFQRRGLKPVELNIAQALGRARDDFREKEVSYEQVRKSLFPDIESYVNRVCGQLVKLKKGRYELVHRSLKKYLTTKPEELQKEYSNSVELPHHAKSYMDEGDCHATLGNICATYLAMPFFGRSVISEYNGRPEIHEWFVWQSAVQKKIDKYKFLRYAALYWSEHLKQAEDLAPNSNTKEWDVDRKRRRLLEDNSTLHAESWIEVWWYYHNWRDWNYPKLRPVSEVISHRPLPAPQVEAHAVEVAAPTQVQLPSRQNQPSTATTPTQIQSLSDEKLIVAPKPQDPKGSSTVKRDGWFVRVIKAVKTRLGKLAESPSTKRTKSDRVLAIG